VNAEGRVSASAAPALAAKKRPNPYSMGPSKYKDVAVSDNIECRTIKVVHAQVDSIFWNWNIESEKLEGLRPQLEAWKLLAQESENRVYRLLDLDVDLFVRPRGYGRYPFVVVAPGVGEVAISYNPKMPAVRARLYSEYLVSCPSPEIAASASHELVEAIFGVGSVTGVGQASAVHVAVDFMGWSPAIAEIFEGRFVCPAGDPIIEEYDRRAGVAHSLRWGGNGSALHAVIYDKPKEIREQSPEKSYLLEKYKAAGWDGVQPVYRLEGRFNRDKLRELGIDLPLDVDPGALLRFVMKWLTLRDKPAGVHVDSDGDVNRSRWSVAAVWSQILDQGCAMLLDLGSIYFRQGRSDPDLGRLELMAGGVLTSYAALRGVSLSEAFRLVYYEHLEKLKREGSSPGEAVRRRRDRFLLPVEVAI
jgi:hypothetical protein